MEVDKQPTKKFINKKENVVSEALDGLCLMNPSLARIKDSLVITLQDLDTKKVNLLCGGGSGHEPAHCGFVDPKMLQAAVCGGVFASPSYQEVQLGIEQIASEKGVLVLIKNYTGDIINFELASGFARTKGINVKTLIVADDIAFVNDDYDIKAKSEARGLSGIVLLYKILGAAAFMGKNLDYVHSLGEKIISTTYTLGVSLTPCSIPGFPSNFLLGDNEMEIGLGIHGEQGKQRTQISEVDPLIKNMINDYFMKFIKKGDEVIILINNLGACTDIEMSIVANSLIKELSNQQITIVRGVEGRIMTSLEMQGILITIHKLHSDIKQEVLQYIDLDVDTKNWKSFQISQNIYVEPKVKIQKSFDENKKVELQTNEGKLFYSTLKTILTNLKTQEKYLNELDSKVGDGDTGIGVSRACTEVLKYLECLDFDTNIKQSILSIGELWANSFGGSSGPLYGIFLSNASIILQNSGNSVENLCEAFINGTKGVQQLGKVKPGERTMYDVLYQVSQLLENIKGQTKQQILQQIKSTTEKSALEVTQMRATKGRSRYLGGKEIGEKDPGCELIVIWVQYLYDILL